MPSKEELLRKLRAGRAELEAALAQLTPEQMLQPETCGAWSVKDMLAHIVSWEQHLLSDYARLFSGQPVYEVQDADIDRTNAATFARWKDVPLAEMQAEFARSYEEVEAWLESASEAQLAAPYLYGMTAGEFVRIDTYEHYAEHLAQLKKLMGG